MRFVSVTNSQVSFRISEDYYKFLEEAKPACRKETDAAKEREGMQQDDGGVSRQSIATKENREPAFAAFLAIDWADKKHYWSLQVTGSDKVERGNVENTPEAVDRWVTQLSRRLEGQPIAVALEQRKGALQVMLGKYGQLHLYPVHPLTLARYRETWYPSRSKDDVKDANLLLEILTQNRSRLRRIDPDTAEMRLLQFQVENRRKLVDERTAVSNRLTDQLKIYYPQLLGWFEDVTSELVGDLLEKWPTLEALQKARPAVLEKFFLRHNCRNEEKMRQRLEEIRSAVPATRDAVVIGAALPMVAVWVKQIAALRESIQSLEKETVRLARQQEDWAIFDALPGAGVVMAPRLMAALGSRRERFQSASELQCFSGIAPVKEASGNSEWIHIRWACPKFLRQTFHEWAACSMPHCDWAKAFYDELRARGKKHHVAVRALAFKWMRILYRCWVDRQPYREETYLANLAKRQRPSLKSLAASVQMP
jgi:transposase